MDVVTKQNYQHHEEMASFSERCSRNYQTKVDGMMQRITDQFNNYERQLLDKDSEFTSQTMEFEGKLQEMKTAVHGWKEEYQRSMDGKHAQAVADLEAKYIKEIDGLLERLGDLQDAVKRAETPQGSAKGSRVRMDGVLSGFISIKKALDLTPLEQVRRNVARRSIPRQSIAKLGGFGIYFSTSANPPFPCCRPQVSMLVKLLQHSQFSPLLASCYDSLESKYRDQLPLKKMASRREFVKYRLNVMERFGENKATTEGGNYESLASELAGLDSGLVKGIGGYERKHGTVFLFEGKNYGEIVGREMEKGVTKVAM